MLGYGITPETFYKKNTRLKLTEAERELFTGRHLATIYGLLSELSLNAMTGPELIDYIELCLSELVLLKIVAAKDARAKKQYSILSATADSYCCRD